MHSKWRITLAIWAAIILYFEFGSVYAKEADLFVVGVRVLLLLAASVYAVFIWLRDLRRGDTDKRYYHLSAYPKSVLRFLFDEDHDPEHRQLRNRS